jgi:RNA polymerase sigma factor (sigma-70 family)
MPSPSTVLLRTQSDERLVALVQAGHERAFEAIVERYRKPLLRACRRILPEARAEDALQQALVAAWKGLERGDTVTDLRPWLYRIARNTALNQLRIAGYDLDELVETLSAAGDPEEEVVRRAVVRQTLAAVAALPERQREALLRTAVEGRGQGEVARDLGLSDTAVRALVHRARVSVRAAATALVPLPTAAWAAGAGGAGAAATLAKAGTLAVLAGGAVTVPAVIHEHGGVRAPAPRPHATAEPRARARAAPPAARTRLVTTAPVRSTAASQPVRHEVSRPASQDRARGGAAENHERSRREDDRSGREAPDHDEATLVDDHRGPGDDSSGRDDPSGHDGSDDGEATTAPVPVPTPVATPEGGDEHHGGGDDSSGPGD